MIEDQSEAKTLQTLLNILTFNSEFLSLLFNNENKRSFSVLSYLLLKITALPFSTKICPPYVHLRQEI